MTGQLPASLLDVALGSRTVADVPWEDLVVGLKQGIFSQDILKRIFKDCPEYRHTAFMQALVAADRTLDKPLLDYLIVNTVFINVPAGFWLLQQKACDFHGALRIFSRGLLAGKKIPIERVFKAGTILAPRKDHAAALMKRNDYLENAVPYYILGRKFSADVYRMYKHYAPFLPFRQDADQVLMGSGQLVAEFISKVKTATDTVVPRYANPIRFSSRRVPIRTIVCSVISGHPNIGTDRKLEILMRLWNKDRVVPLDNLIQLNVIPREVFYFADLREHCTLSEQTIYLFEKGGFK